LFVLSIERPTRTHWLLYALASVFAIYAHVFGILVVASHWGSLVFLRRREVPWKGLFASTSIIGVLASPLAILLFIRSTEPSAPLAWAPKPTFHHIYTLFYSLVGLADFSGAPGGKPVVAAYFLVCCVALVSGIGMWRSIGRSLKTWRVELPFACLFVPIVLTLAVSMVKPIFVSKYLLICLPFLLLLAANGIQSIKPKSVAVAVLVSTAGLTTIGLPSYYKFRARDHEWESVTAHILEQSKPGDAAIFYIAPGRLCFDYYRAKYRGAKKDVHVVYPEFADEDRDAIVLRDTPPMRSDLADYVATRHHRVWVVLYHDDFAFTSGLSHRIQDSLYGKYRKVQKIVTEGPWPYERVTLLLYADGTDDRNVTSSAQSGKAPVEQ
jgi:hypothetical protein